jgi:LDH2 family malate/lactate/ureidoglycolate dehydrogenase
VAARIRVIRDRVWTLMDADGALGVLPAWLPPESLPSATVVRRRRGRCRNSNHSVRPRCTRRLARDGLIGIAVTSAASRVAPHGGVEPLFGNPSV